MKNILNLYFLIFITMSCYSQKELQQKTTDITHIQSVDEIHYPYNFTYEGNPLVRHLGAADPDVHVWDGVVWVYTSQDRTVDTTIHPHHYAAMDGYHVFSSKDMINWIDHGEILHSSDIEWGWEDGGYMWAPGAARKDGKYYLYFPHKDKEGQWRVGVAVADAPTGPFEDIGHPIDGFNSIDPKVFIDDDGEAYIYNNPGVVAKLKPNMIELAEEPRKIIYASEGIMENDTLGFKEGAYMHKRDGIYYFSYTNWRNKSYQGYYAMGNNPYGPFEWKGAIAPKPQGAQDHHSIVKFGDQWFYFYHIAIKDYPKFKEAQGRIACYDSLYYNDDGTIKMVEHTRQ